MTTTTIDLVGGTQTFTGNLNNNDTLIVVGPGTLDDTGNVNNGATIDNTGAFVDISGNIGSADLQFVSLIGTYELDPVSVHGAGEFFTGVAAGDKVILNETFNGGSLVGNVMTLTENGNSVDSFGLTLALGASNTFDFSTVGTLSAFENVVCFAAGAHIATPGGEVPVERLAIGDHVLTASGQGKPVRWIGHGCHLITKPGHDGASPVIVRAGALGDGMPHRDLRLTKGHSLFVDGVLIPVEFLINHRSILWDERPQVIEFFHVELEDHDILIAEGAPSESYRDDGNRRMFDNVNPAWDPC
jgi:Hint domain-containing protein